jgi:hypothetical protein
MNYLDIASLHSQLNLLYLFALVASVDQNLVQTVGWNQDFALERITEHVLLSSRFINIGNTYNNNNNDNDNDNDNDNGNIKFYFLTTLRYNLNHWNTGKDCNYCTCKLEDTKNLQYKYKIYI